MLLPGKYVQRYVELLRLLQITITRLLQVLLLASWLSRASPSPTDPNDPEVWITLIFVLPALLTIVALGLQARLHGLGLGVEVSTVL